MGAKVVGSLTPEVTGAPALERVDRSAARAISALSSGSGRDLGNLADKSPARHFPTFNFLHWHKYIDKRIDIAVCSLFLSLKDTRENMKQTGSNKFQFFLRRNVRN